MMASRDEWDLALARYRVAKIIQEASEAWGPHALQNEAHTIAAIHLHVDRDSGGRATEEQRQRWTEIQPALNAAYDACSDAIYHPMWIAAAELVACPSPDLAALQVKHEVIKEEEVWNCSFAADLGVDCWAVLLEETERLTGLKIKDCTTATLPPECSALTLAEVRGA